MRCVHAMRFGAALQPGGGAMFRLWAPAARSVELLLHHARGVDARSAMRNEDGWCEMHVDAIAVGQRYQWRIDGSLVVPDPASRCNPEGPHAPSELTDPQAFVWPDEDWRGRPWHDAVFYQVHIGTWTRAGTYDAAVARLPELVALGVTAVQLMPLADFPGAYGWGYDGVLPYAPYHGYGRPDALKRFVAEAHQLGLMVFGDVVYNHFGPDGNYLHAYAPQFFTARHQTAWGDAINYDDVGADTVRRFVIDNALYWLHEYRFDGLRLDAVHAMRDDSRHHILQTLSEEVRAAFPDRHVHLVLENDTNDAARLGAPGTPGRYDGQWSGDVHHALHVLLTGEHDGYYAEYDQPPAQLGRALAHGFARVGGPHNVPGAPPRRAATGSVPLSATINFLQNHDQIGNRAYGERLVTLADPRAVRLAAAIVCLAPSPPLLFMGEECGATQPFLYFADWQGELRDAVRRGRAAEFAHFARYAEAAARGDLPDPCNRISVDACCIAVQPADSAAAAAWRAHYTLLLRVRAQALRPWLPRLLSHGHEAHADAAGLLRVRWHFAAEEPAGAAPSSPPLARMLQMQVNLSAQWQPVTDPDVAHHNERADNSLLLALGDTSAGGLGPWSGRWTWLP